VPTQANLPTLLVGHANQRDGAAELRTWEHVDAICRERFKQRAPIDPAQYQQFLQSAQGFLAACGLRVSFAPTPDEMSTRRSQPDEPPAPKRSLALVVSVTVTLLVAGAAIWALVAMK
jgi:hypothetical protein